MKKIKRSLFKTFIDTTPTGESSTYNLLGVNVSELSVDYAPQSESSVDIVSDSADTEITSYQPTAGLSAVATEDDPVFEFVNGLRRSRAVLDDACTSIVNVDLYDPVTGSDGSYVAEKQDVSIQIDSYGGAGGESLKIEYTINYRGDPVKGTFAVASKTFTVDT